MLRPSAERPLVDSSIKMPRESLPTPLRSFHHSRRFLAQLGRWSMRSECPRWHCGQQACILLWRSLARQGTEMRQDGRPNKPSSANLDYIGPSCRRLEKALLISTVARPRNHSSKSASPCSARAFLIPALPISIPESSCDILKELTHHSHKIAHGRGAMEIHRILGDKVRLYRRAEGGPWHCSTFLKSK